MALALLPAAASAKTLEFPSDAPIVSIMIPDSWGPHETESGIEATSDDSAIYLSIDVAEEGTTDKVIDDAVAFLDENGVKVDVSTQKQTDEDVNGMTMTDFAWSGKDKDGDVDVSLSLVSPKPGKLLVITYWGSKAEQDKHANDLIAMLQSFKPYQ